MRLGVCSSVTNLIQQERVSSKAFPSTKTTSADSVIEIFRSEDKTALKELISNENEGNTQINQVLRMVNIDGTGPQDIVSRREINRSFMTCLIGKLGRPEALIWIKKHLDPEFCNSILSDMNYTGQHFKQLLSMLLNSCYQGNWKMLNHVQGVL